MPKPLPKYPPPREGIANAPQPDEAKVDGQQILSFYVGENTPKQKGYIMEDPVVTVEE